jgi:hypothetical protein
MTTSADIEAEFITRVFADSDLQTTYSSKLIRYALAEEAEIEITAISLVQRINFFQLLIRRQDIIEGLQVRSLQFPIQIRYTVEKDAQNLAYQKVRDGLELVQDLVREELYPEIGGLVDIIEFGEMNENISINIASTPCWMGQINYTALTTV